MRNHINSKVGLAYLEGRLDGAQQAKLERHLADCETCQTELLEHQTTHDLLQAAGQDFLPEPAQIPKWTDVKGKQAKRPLLNTIFQYGSQVAMAGAALVLLLVFIWQLRPQDPVLEVAPSVTATNPAVIEPTPQATGLPSPSVIIIPGTEPTVPADVATAEPTRIPAQSEPTRIRGNEISAVSLNRQGRAALVVDGTLYVETAANSATFSTIADNVQLRPPAWSADGQEMIFFSKADDPEQPVLMHWSAETGQSTPFNDLIDRPLPTVSFIDIQWAENGREILLPAQGKLTPKSEWDSSVWLADLDTGSLTLVVEAIALNHVEWLTANTFLMTLDCGVDCTTMMAYDTAKNMLWKAYHDRPEFEAASDLYVVQPNEQRILLLDRHDVNPSLDLLNTVTGEITTPLEFPDGQIADFQPYLAQNGQIVVFQLIDNDGQTAFLETFNLLDSTHGVINLQHSPFTFGNGAWDSAGNYFIFSLTDKNLDTTFVYLWQPANNTTTLIQAEAGSNRFQSFTWTADGRYVYYNLGNEELWQYDIVTEELRAVAGR